MAELRARPRGGISTAASAERAIGPSSKPQEPSAPTFGLQQSLGNQAVQRLASGCPAFSACPTGGACHACPFKPQAKLVVGTPGDVYEQEADRVAERITGTAVEGSAGQPAGVLSVPRIQRTCPTGSCDDELRRQPDAEDEVWAQLSAEPGKAATLAQPAERQVQAVRGGGQPLPAGSRAAFEARFGHDFRDVRVHADGGAAASARALGARAYTVGRDVVFGAGEYAPETAEGSQLLAHELTHVVQQGQAPPARVARSPVGGSSPVAPSPVTRRTGEVVQGAWWSWEGAKEGAWQGALGTGLSLAGGIGLGLGLAALLTPGGLGMGLLAALGIVGLGGLAGAAVGGLFGFLLGGLLGPKKPECKYEKIASAAALSITWLNRAIARLWVYVMLSSLADDARLGEPLRNTRRALNRHFHATDDGTAAAVVSHLMTIHERIRPWTNPSQVNPHWLLSPACSGKDPRCDGDTVAYVTRGTTVDDVMFCPRFFGMDDVHRADTLIHEIAHTLGDDVRDRGYSHERIYPYLSTENALHNAESFSSFVMDLGGPGAELTVPRDEFEDCPAEWRPALERALATADYWNRAATHFSKAGIESRIRQLHLSEDAGDALKTFEKVETELDSPLQVECEPESGGRCEGGTVTYWYGIWSDYHVCPAWLALDRERQAFTFLSGLYGHLGGVGSSSRQDNYTRIARSLTSVFERINPAPAPAGPTTPATEGETGAI